MSYPSWNCYFAERVNYFSNPDVMVKGKWTGTNTTDNARTIKENMVRYASIDPSSLEFLVAVSSLAVR